MKILFVSSGNSRWNVIPFIKSQGESLISAGQEVNYFTIQGKGIKGYLKNTKKLRDYLKNHEVDIIHAHFGKTGLVCVLTFPKIPIVLSVMGKDAYGDFNSNGKRITTSYLGIFITQIAMLFVKRIIVKSKNIYKLVVLKKKTHIIPNGVDFQKFKPNSFNKDYKNVLYLANNNDTRKNYKLLKNAIDLIDDIEIKLINPYPIEPSEFPKYLNNSSVFVLTSYNEGSPNVIKEAMACNIPVVSTDVGDVKEVIGKTNGCYITTFEPEDVAKKVKLALEFGKRTNGRENIKHLESSIIAKKIIDLYKEVLTGYNT